MGVRLVAILQYQGEMELDGEPVPAEILKSLCPSLINQCIGGAIAILKVPMNNFYSKN